MIGSDVKISNVDKGCFFLLGFNHLQIFFFCFYDFFIFVAEFQHFHLSAWHILPLLSWNGSVLAARLSWH